MPKANPKPNLRTLGQQIAQASAGAPPGKPIIAHLKAVFKRGNGA